MSAVNTYVNLDVLRRKKKIAILDSGINIDFSDFKGKKIEIISINKEKKWMDADKNGHGTSCCGEILKYYPNAEIVILPVLDEKKRCNLLDLYQALLYCYQDEEIGIINMSLACMIEDLELISCFHALITQMHYSGKLMIAANMNNVKIRKYIHILFLM